MKRKVVATLVTVCMILTMLPMAVFAAGNTVTYDLNEGSWQTSTSPDGIYASGETVNLTQETPVREGYDFTGWEITTTASPDTFASGATFPMTVTPDEAEAGFNFAMPDGPVTITAQWQIIYCDVTLNVVNGTWADGSTTQSAQVVYGRYLAESSVLEGVPNDGYEGGSWDNDPFTTQIKGNMTFTYTYTEKSEYNDVTFKVVNGTWANGTTADQVATVVSGNTLAPEEVPTGMIPDEGYESGAWDVEPNTTDPVTAAVTYTYTFAAKQATVEPPTATTEEDGTVVVETTVSGADVSGLVNSETGNLEINATKADAAEADSTKTQVVIEAATVAAIAGEQVTVAVATNEGTLEFDADAWNTIAGNVGDSAVTLSLGVVKPSEENPDVVINITATDADGNELFSGTPNGQVAIKGVLAPVGAETVAYLYYGEEYVGKFDVVEGKVDVTLNHFSEYRLSATAPAEEPEMVPVTFTVDGGTWNAVSGDTVTIDVASGDTLSAEQIPDVTAVVPDENHQKTGKWNKDPVGQEISGENCKFIYTLDEQSKPTTGDTFNVFYDANGGSWTYVDENEYAEGDEVQIPSEKPVRSGYTFQGWTCDIVGHEDELHAAGSTFIMPADDVTLTAQWKANSGSNSSGGGGGGTATSYAVVVKTVDNGKVTTSHTSASKNTVVTLTVTPDSGYSLSELLVEAANDEEVTLNKESDTKYTFAMPGARVTVTATFVEGEAEVTPDDEEDTEDTEFPFVDVTESDWYYNAVQYAYDNGLMAGTATAVFSPNTTVTRGMIVAILYRLEGEPEVTATNPFVDVAADQYYADAVVWASANNIVSGYGDGIFGPNNAITREQMAAFLYRYAQYKGYDTTLGSVVGYADANQISDWAMSAMQWACGTELISGKGNGILDPLGTATRAEAAQILMQFCEGVVVAE